MARRLLKVILPAEDLKQDLFIGQINLDRTLLSGRIHCGNPGGTAIELSFVVPEI